MYTLVQFYVAINFYQVIASFFFTLVVALTRLYMSAILIGHSKYAHMLHLKGFYCQFICFLVVLKRLLWIALLLLGLMYGKLNHYVIRAIINSTLDFWVSTRLSGICATVFLVASSKHNCLQCLPLAGTTVFHYTTIIVKLNMWPGLRNSLLAHVSRFNFS